MIIHCPIGCWRGNAQNHSIAIRPQAPRSKLVAGRATPVQFFLANNTAVVRQEESDVISPTIVLLGRHVVLPQMGEISVRRIAAIDAPSSTAHGRLNEVVVCGYLLTRSAEQRLSKPRRPERLEAGCTACYPASPPFEGRAVGGRWGRRAQITTVKCCGVWIQFLAKRLFLTSRLSLTGLPNIR